MNYIHIVGNGELALLYQQRFPDHEILIWDDIPTLILPELSRLTFERYNQTASLMLAIAKKFGGFVIRDNYKDLTGIPPRVAAYFPRNWYDTFFYANCVFMDTLFNLVLPAIPMRAVEVVPKEAKRFLRNWFHSPYYIED